MCSYPTRNRKFQKTYKKFKKLEKTIIASFQDKIGWERLRTRERKIKLFLWVFSRPGIENLKKIAEKLKKLENTIIASFQAKIGREWPRKTKNKKYRSDGFLPNPE